MTFQIFNELPQLPPTSPSDAGKEVVVNSSGGFNIRNPLAYEYKVSDTEDRNSYQNIAALQDGGVPVEITQLTLTITPRSTNSKIKLHGVVCGGWYERSYARGIIIGRIVDGTETIIRAAAPTGTDPDGNAWRRTRVLASWLGDSHHFNRLSPANLNFLYVDDPQTTSAITYKVYLVNTHPGSLGDFYLNGTESLNNDGTINNTEENELGVSTFIAEEKG